VYSRTCGSVHTCTRYRPLPPAQHCCGCGPGRVPVPGRAIHISSASTHGHSTAAAIQQSCVMCRGCVTGVVASSMRG
jgi:hypothetical protein